VHQLEIKLLDTIFMVKLLCKICQTVSLSMLINSATARMLPHTTRCCQVYR